MKRATRRPVPTLNLLWALDDIRSGKTLSRHQKGAPNDYYFWDSEGSYITEKGYELLEFADKWLPFVFTFGRTKKVAGQGKSPVQALRKEV